MSRQRTITVEINPSHDTYDGRLQLSTVEYKSGFVMASYVPDLNDDKVKRQVLSLYLCPMGWVDGEKLVKEIRKNIIRSPKKEDFRYLSRGLDMPVKDVQKLMEKKKRGYAGEALEFALESLAIDKGTEVWRRGVLPKEFPAIYEFAVLEYHIPSKVPRRKLVARREEILEGVRKSLEEETRGIMEQTKSDIDKFDSKVKDLAFDFRKRPQNIVREILSGEETLISPPGGVRFPRYFDRVAFINQIVTERVREKIPGARLAEFDSFGDDKTKVTFRIIYSEDAPSIGPGAEDMGLPNTF